MIWASIDDVTAALTAATGPLGEPLPLTQVFFAVETASAIAAGYVGRTWPDPDVPPEVAAVVALVALRFAFDATQKETDTLEEAELRQTVRGGFHGLTLTEQVLLNRYRTRWAAV